MAVEGQLEGISIMALGETLSEKHILDSKSGKLLTANFGDYKLPIAADLQGVQSALVETIDPEGPFGAKEGGVTCGPAVCGAIANAIHDATGIWIKELPASPEKMLIELAK